MNYEFILFIIMVIAILLLFTKYNIVTSSPELLEATKYDPHLVNETQKKINALITKANTDVASVLEFFTNDINGKFDISIMLFFNQSCPQCQKFYPIWKQITSLLAASVHVTEIECNKEKALCRQYKIEVVPTIVISINGKETRFIGKMTEEDLKAKLENLKIPMKAHSTEAFVDYISAAQVEAEGDSRKSKDPDCPYMSFYEGDKGYYCADSNYLYGCINASQGSDIPAFDGAFGVITSYINSIPSSKLDVKKKCLSKYSHIIKSWNLCDPAQLSAKRNYSEDIASQISKPRFLKVNYDDNIKAVDAINYACNFT